MDGGLTFPLRVEELLSGRIKIGKSDFRDNRNLCVKTRIHQISEVDMSCNSQKTHSLTYTTPSVNCSSIIPTDCATKCTIVLVLVIFLVFSFVV